MESALLVLICCCSVIIPVQLIVHVNSQVLVRCHHFNVHSLHVRSCGISVAGYLQAARMSEPCGRSQHLAWSNSFIYTAFLHQSSYYFLLTWAMVVPASPPLFTVLCSAEAAGISASACLFAADFTHWLFHFPHHQNLAWKKPLWFCWQGWTKQVDSTQNSFFWIKFGHAQ